MSARALDVAIVGAGYAGLACAIACADADLDVLVLERRPALAPEGVALVLQPNGLAALERLGLLEQVLAVGHRIDDVKQCDERGRVRASGMYRDLLEHPHPYLLVVERAAVIAILARRALERSEIRFGVTITGVADSRLLVDAGEPIHARCIIGADGAGSAVRAAIAPRLGWRTGPDRFLIGLADGRPPDDAAVLHCGPGWCDGVMPLRDRTYFFDHLVGATGEAWERGDFDAWRDAYSARVPDGARIAAGLSSFDDVAFLSGRTHRAAPRVQGSLALAGDAAAAVHPHNGQGANLALDDAVALRSALLAPGASVSSALARYGRERDAVSRRQVPWSIFIGRTFDGPNAFWRANRRFGYAASRIPAVRRATTAQQAGVQRRRP